MNVAMNIAKLKKNTAKRSLLILLVTDSLPLPMDVAGKDALGVS